MRGGQVKTTDRNIKSIFIFHPSGFTRSDALK